MLPWIVQYQGKAIPRFERWRSPTSRPSKASTTKSSSFSHHHNHHYHHRPKSSTSSTASITTSTIATPACPLSEESYAILGGDSDLVLEELVIQATHVFVLLPDGKNRYLSVSLWETSRTLLAVLENSNDSGRNAQKQSQRISADSNMRSPVSPWKINLVQNFLIL